MKSLVIVPTYNELENLPIIIQKILKDAPGCDILIVDDASPDGTGALADDFAIQNSQICVLHRSTKDGLGGAYRAGFRFANENKYEAVIQLDADGSHPTTAIPVMLDLLHTNDLVIGSRWVHGGAVVNWPFHRKILSRGGNLYARILLRLSIKDATAGFRAFRIEALNSIGLLETESQGYVFQVESSLLATRAGLRIVETPITFAERELGASKMSQQIVLEAMFRVTQWAFARR